MSEIAAAFLGSFIGSSISVLALGFYIWKNVQKKLDKSSLGGMI